MNATAPFSPADLEAMAKMYFSDKISIALGSQFLAVTFDAVFLGILFGQTLKWIPHARNDAVHIRTFIIISLLGCFASTCFSWKNYFEAFVLKFGTYLRFASWEHLGLYALFNGFTIIPVEIIFADRAIRINDKNPILAVGLTMLIGGTTLCTTGSIATSRGHTMFDGTPLMVKFFLAQGAMCAAMHLAVTSAICFGLWKNREGSRRTNRIIDKIIWITLEGQIPGTIISFLAILLAAINLANPFIPWLMIVHPKMYMMGCLAMINTRHTWSAEGRLLSTINSSGANTDSEKGMPTNPPVNRVSVRRSTVQMFDDFETSVTVGCGSDNELGVGKKEKEVDKSKSSYGSFGPILSVSDIGLGSKVSMA